MKNFTGIIIEESLRNKKILSTLKIVKTEISPVTEKHQTPHLIQWILHIVEVFFRYCKIP
jgi:hypothetical protein